MLENEKLEIYKSFYNSDEPESNYSIFSSKIFYYLNKKIFILKTRIFYIYNWIIENRKKYYFYYYIKIYIVNDNLFLRNPQFSFVIGSIFSGDLMDEENVLDFLTSLEAMDLPDRIEEVNSKILEKIVEETEFVAVLFCEFSSPRNPSTIFS